MFNNPPFQYEVSRKEDDSVLTCSMYLESALTSDLREMYETMREVLSSAKVEFDTIVGMGLSGALVVPRLGELFDCCWAVVRKDLENSHGRKRIEGSIGREWLLVDDLIASGSTAKNIVHYMEKLKANTDFQTSLVGAYVYNDQEFWTLDDLESEGIREKSTVRSASKLLQELNNG